VVIEALNNGADFYIQKGGEAKSQFAGLANKIRHAVSLDQSEKAPGSRSRCRKESTGSRQKTNCTMWLTNSQRTENGQATLGIVRSFLPEKSAFSKAYCLPVRSFLNPGTV